MSRKSDNIIKNGEATDLIFETERRLKSPSLYRVMLVNDDFTPMDFVVDILETVFRKAHEEAVAIMMDVHHQGLGLCGIYTFEVAESKVSRCTALARRHQHPLQCIMEKQ